jgi:hypothetical protein
MVRACCCCQRWRRLLLTSTIEHRSCGGWVWGVRTTLPVPSWAWALHWGYVGLVLLAQLALPCAGVPRPRSAFGEMIRVLYHSLGNSRRLGHAHYHFRPCDCWHGAWALLALLFDETVKVHLTHYAAAVGILSGGLSMVGLAQALRLLFEIRGALPSQLEGPRRRPGAL